MSDPDRCPSCGTAASICHHFGGGCCTACDAATAGLHRTPTPPPPVEDES